MKVKELIELLSKCNPDARVTSVDCRMFQKEHYYPICLEYCNVDDNLHREKSDPENANVVFVH